MFVSLLTFLSDQKTFGVINYHQAVGGDWHGALKAKLDVYLVAQFLAGIFPDIGNLPAFLKEWDADYYEYASMNAQIFVRFAVDQMWEYLKDVDQETAAKHIRDLIQAVTWYREHAVSLKFQNFL